MEGRTGSAEDVIPRAWPIKASTEKQRGDPVENPIYKHGARKPNHGRQGAQSLSDTNCFHLPGEDRAPGFLSEVWQLGGPSPGSRQGSRLAFSTLQTRLQLAEGPFKSWGHAMQELKTVSQSSFQGQIFAMTHKKGFCALALAPKEPWG